MNNDIKISNKIDNILVKYPAKNKSDLGKILTEMQSEFRHINETIIKKVSGYLGISLTDIYGYASFYSIYSLEEPGRYIIKICRGTACHVKGAKRLLDEIEKILGIKPGETTEDKLFTLEVSSCLGICSLAPALIINDKTYTRVTGASLRTIINSYKQDQITQNTDSSTDISEISKTNKKTDNAEIYGET